MALQKELIALVSNGIGVAPETVTVMDRLLLESGMRTRSLRGRAKTPMTYRDAASLIIAAALNHSPNETVRHVTDYRDLKAATGKDLGETFGEAIEDVLKRVAQEPEIFRADYHAATVSLFGPNPYARIELRLPGGVEGEFAFGPWQGQTVKQPVVRRVDLHPASFLAIAEAIARDLPDSPQSKTGIQR